MLFIKTVFLSITNYLEILMKVGGAYLVPIRMTDTERLKLTAAGEGKEKGEHLYTVGWNVNWKNHHGQ